jgi:plasmid stabilization system protein ParE
MKLRFTPRSVENIAHIADYIHARNPPAAQRVRDDIYDGMRNLILFPQAGRSQQTEGVRKFMTRRYPLFALLHGRRCRRRNRCSECQAPGAEARAR